MQQPGTWETLFHGADTGLGAGAQGGAVCHSPKKRWTHWVVLSTILLKGWTLLGLHNKKFTSFKKKDSLFLSHSLPKSGIILTLSFH